MPTGDQIHWSAYPALLVAAAFAAGIVSDRLFVDGRTVLWGAAIGTGLVAYAIAELLEPRRMVSLAPLGRVLGLGLIVLGGGGLRHGVYTTLNPDELGPVAAHFQNEPLSVGGIVSGAPEHGGEGVRFVIDVRRISVRGDTTTVAGRVQVTLRTPPWEDRRMSFPHVREGDRIRVRSELDRPPGQRNPAGFDYAAYLARRGICCVAYVGNPADVEVQSKAEGAFAVVGIVREYVRTQIDRYVARDNGRAVLQALLLGDRGGISDTLREWFARTGLMHLLAVSGLHVFLVGMVLYVVLRPVLLRFRMKWWLMETARATCTILVLGFYMLLTGARPSVVRAVVMATLFIGGVVFQRSSRPLNTLGVAALVLLAVRPTALYDVGFQLSMAAVAGILTLQPRLSEPIPDRWRASGVGDWLVSMVVVSTAAILGTAPVLLYHFGLVSAAGLVLNVVGIPATGLVLAAGIAMVVIGGVSSSAGVAFGAAVDVFVRGLLATARHGSVWFSWAGVRMAEPDVVVLGAFVAGVVAVAQWSRPRVRWRSVGVGLFLATVSVWSGVLLQRPSLDVLFFDVGHGDATLVSTPGDHHVLVDTGPSSPGGADVDDSVLPYLERHGIRHLDAVIVTHPDADHLGGLPSVVQEVSVGTMYHGGWDVQTDLYHRSRRVLREHGVVRRAVNRGDVWQVGSSLRVEVLGPPVRHSFENANDASVVVRLAYGSVSVLLPGDIEADAERVLTQRFRSGLHSTIVKVPHHGSRTSSTERFVRAVSDSSETRAIVSAGEANRYGMPHRGPLLRWKRWANCVYRTSTNGAVWLRTDGTDVWRVTWR